MLTIDCEQYSKEWWSERLGKPTASQANEITTSTGQESKSLPFLAFKLADQIKNSMYLDTFETEWMSRGHDLEPKAREIYQISTGINLVQTGIIFKDEKKLFGCSPDGIGIQSGCEIKCPSYEKHMRYRFDNKLPVEYKPQVYSSLWVCDELEWWDFFSYYPNLPPFVCRVTRDSEDYKKYIGQFEIHLNKLHKKIKEMIK